MMTNSMFETTRLFSHLLYSVACLALEQELEKLFPAT
jgi:hypothetical protein